jgi:hypothetical protein
LTDRHPVDNFAQHNIREQSQRVSPTPVFRKISFVMQRRIILSLLTAGAVAMLLGLRSLSSEASASRITSLPSDADTTIVGDLTVSVGDDVGFQLTVTNNSSRRIELRFPSGRTHDFVVLDSIGREVWRWSTGKMFTQVVQNRSIDKGQSITFSTNWKNPDAIGTYTAVAKLWSRNFPIEQRTQIVIPDRR